jgi:hypothetical protein
MEVLPNMQLQLQNYELDRRCLLDFRKNVPIRGENYDQFRVTSCQAHGLSSAREPFPILIELQNKTAVPYLASSVAFLQLACPPAASR